MHYFATLLAPSTLLRDLPFSFLQPPLLSILIFFSGAVRNTVIDETVELIKTLSIPYFVTSMSKGGISERLGKFGGVYGGAGSFAAVKSGVETSDLVLFVGRYPVSFLGLNLDFSIFWANSMLNRAISTRKLMIG